MRSDDELLVNRCLEGDQPAFAFLVDKYKEVVHAYAYRVVGDYQEAEDIAQEVFIKAYKKLAQLKWPHKFRSWLYTIASNECKMWLRRHSNEREQEVSWEDVPVEELDELAVRAHSDEDIELTVKSAMETLPDDRELALSLYYMSSLSVKEIAHFMGVSPNSVRIKLHRARKQLGERLEKMIGKQLNKEKLKAGFVFKVVDSIRDMPIPSVPKPRPIRWAPIPISIGMALMIGIIGLGISSDRDVSPDVPILKQETFAVSLLPDVDEQKALDMKNNDESQLVALYTGNDGSEETVGNTDKDIVVRKVKFSVRAMGDNTSPSPDGRYLSYPNGENGNLAVLDLTTGESRELTDEGRWEGAQRHAIDSTWSPDGKQIAYHWFNEDTQELRIVGLDGSEPRVLHPTEGSKGRILGCYDWSQDGKYILAWLAGTQEIVLVPVDGGSIRILKSPAPRPERMTLSPDSRYIVYDRPLKEHEDLRDIFLLTTDGSGEETRLTENPANDYGPVWSTDGNSIVFISNRIPDGTMGFWIMQIVDGKPAGKPQLVKKEAGNISIRGFTEKGSLFYSVRTHWSDIYVTSVDIETGELLSEPELIPTQGIVDTMPTWSPDGESLAYLSERTVPGSFHPQTILVIRSLETGEERELCSMPGTNLQLRWSPDGRSILYLHYGINLIDVQTGHITPKVAAYIEEEKILHPAWSPDGNTIFYTRRRFGKGEWRYRIVALDLETRNERELCPGGDPGAFLAVSPDGQQLAFIDGDRQMIKVISTEGGEPRILLDKKDFNLQDFWFGAPFAWTSDGRYILFYILIDEKPDSSVQQLWRVSAEGGIPQKLQTLLKAEEIFFPIYIYPFSLHPDGRRIAFQKGRNGHLDLWVMENLLPTYTASR